jgi:hypothetical protein
MSARQANLPEENIYLFFGLQDFESDKRKIKRAYSKLTALYHLHSSGGEETGKNKRLTKLKEIFPEMSDDGIREFAQDKMQNVTAYYAILNAKKDTDNIRAKYDAWLESRTDLQQNYQPSAEESEIIGRQLLPNADNPASGQALIEFHESQSGQLALPNKAGGLVSIQDQAINALARYHKHQDDLAEQKLLEHKAAFINKSAAVEEDVEETETADSDDFQNNEPQEPDVAPEGETPDAVQKSFQDNAREQCIYPPDGEKSALYGSPMVLKATSGDYGNIDLNVLSGIDGQARTAFGHENGFALAGKLAVGPFGVKSNDQHVRKVAITGTLDIKCSGAFINGDVDGRIRKAKIAEKKVQNEQGQVVNAQIETESFKKGAIEIDAGDEDVVINGDMLGKVIVKTRGNIRVIGNVSDKVHLHAGGSIEIYGDVTGNCKALAHGEVTIRGKKQWSVQTTERISVHCAAIDPEYREALRQHIASGEAPQQPKDQERAKAKESFAP